MCQIFNVYTYGDIYIYIYLTLLQVLLAIFSCLSQVLTGHPYSSQLAKSTFHIECRPVISTSIFPNISISTLFPSVSIFSSHILQHFQVQLRICHGPKAASAEHLHLLRSPERLRQGPAVDTGLGAVEALTLGTWQGKPRETHLLKCPTYPQKIPKSRYFRLVLVEFIQMHPC